MVDQVKDLDPRNQYTATSGQTIFPYTFPIFDKDDLVVIQEGTTLAEGTNYTVSGVGDEDGGNVTLLVGATTGDTITIYRDQALERLVDYQTSGDFLAADVNNDFDRQLLMIQQLSRDVSRSLSFSQDDEIASTQIGNLNTRANRLLAFDANGELTYQASTTLSPVADSLSDTIAAAKALNLVIGDYVRTGGYTSFNDGGGALYRVVSGGTGTDDGGSYHDMSNGLQLELITKDIINGKAFGINGTGDLAKIQAALAFAAGRPVDITGASNLSGTIQNITNANLISNGEKITLSGVLTFDNTNTNLKLENVNFDATSVPNGTSNAVVISNSGLFESINSGVTNAPRGNMLVSKVSEVKGYGGDFSDAGQENFVSGSVNIGVGLHLYGIVTRGRWYNPIANDCWQIGVFINGNTGEVCNDMVVYGASVANAQDNGIRVQPEDAAYATCVDCGFIDPVVDNSTIDNIRLNGIRSFVKGGYSTNATGWACKSDGGTDIVMRGLTCRGNGSGVGARVVENLDGLYVSEIDSDNPTSTPAIYCVQITSGKTVHNVKFDNNKTDGGSQADLAIILVNSADGLNLSASNNIYRGDSSTNYREVFGVCPYVTSINNSAEGDCTRAFTNASNCTDIDVIGFNGAGAPLWGIEANNGTAAGSYSACSWHNITSVAVGGADAANFAATYTISNLSTDRTYDANATTTAELADVLGTLITDLKNNGILL